MYTSKLISRQLLLAVADVHQDNVAIARDVYFWLCPFRIPCGGCQPSLWRKEFSELFSSPWYSPTYTISKSLRCWQCTSTTAQGRREKVRILTLARSCGVPSSDLHFGVRHICNILKLAQNVFSYRADCQLSQTMFGRQRMGWDLSLTD